MKALQVKFLFASDIKLYRVPDFWWRCVFHFILNWMLLFLTQTQSRIEITYHHSRSAPSGERGREHFAKRKQGYFWKICYW